MVRFNFYLQNDQFKFLKDLSKDSASIAEYVRIAINEFIKKKKTEKLNVSESLSVKK